MNRNDNRLPKLKEMDQWVCWGYHCRDRNECGAEVSADANECPECGAKVTKPPLSPISGQFFAKSNDSDTWGTYQQATDYHAREDTHTHGVGFILSSTDMIVGIDLDGCRHPETDELEPWAEEIIETVDSYTEVSPSGTGLRIFAVGMLPDGGNKGKQERTLDLPTWVQENKNAEVEMYDDVRYMTYTGEQLEGTPNEAKQRPEEVKEVHAEYVADETDESDETHDDVEVELDDSSSEPEGSAEFTNQFGTSLKRIRNWDEKLDSLLTHLEPAYSLQEDDNSPSGYDYATVVKLVYWRFSDGDIKRILRRYRSRDKLDRDDYIRETIRNAKKDQKEQCAPPLVTVW